MRLGPALAVGSVLLAACSSSGPSAVATSGATSTASRSTSTPTVSRSPSSPTSTPPSSLDLSAIKVPRACVSPRGQRLSNKQAGACYLALKERTNIAVPIVTQNSNLIRADLPTVKQAAQEAVDALLVDVKGLRTASWPESVAPLTAQLADFEARMVPPLQHLARASNPDEAETAFHQFEDARGPIGPNPIGVAIRRKLGLPQIS